MKYSGMFPQAKRILASMMETVRPLSLRSHVYWKYIGAQDIQTSTGTKCIPADTKVYTNTIALHPISY